ncbi:MAG: hypothetical protein U0528_03650 [Anaerolineae bacterium]
MQSLILKPIPPYDFDKLLQMLRRFPTTVLDHAVGDTYRRVLRVRDQLALVQVATNVTDSSLLRASVLTQTGQIDSAALTAELGKVLALVDDRRTFSEYARTNAPLHTAIEPVIALPMLRSQTAYEALVSAIIEQQISWRGALKAQRWLLEWGGHSLEHNGERWYAHPIPDQIAGATLADLKPLKITDKRIRLLIEVSQLVAEGKLQLDDLPATDAYPILTAIKGIGHWTAAVTLSRTLRSTNYVGTNDVALQAAVNWFFFGREGRADVKTLVELFAGLGEHAGRTADLVLSRWVIERY